MLGVHHATVASVRSGLEVTGQIIQCASPPGGRQPHPAGPQADDRRHRGRPRRVPTEFPDRRDEAILPGRPRGGGDPQGRRRDPQASAHRALAIPPGGPTSGRTGPEGPGAGREPGPPRRLPRPAPHPGGRLGRTGRHLSPLRRAAGRALRGGPRGRLPPVHRRLDGGPAAQAAGGRLGLHRHPAAPPRRRGVGLPAAARGWPCGSSAGTSARN